MSIVKRSSAEIKQELLTNLTRLTDTVHFNYWPVLVNLAKGARLQQDVVDFMLKLNELPNVDSKQVELPNEDFKEMLASGSFRGKHVPQRGVRGRFILHEQVPPITSAKDFYYFLEANDILEDKNAHKAILTFALQTNIEHIKKFASGESLMTETIRRE